MSEEQFRSGLPDEAVFLMELIYITVVRESVRGERDTSRCRAKIPGLAGLAGLKHTRVGVVLGLYFTAVINRGARYIVGIGVARDAGTERLITGRIQAW